MDNDKKLDLAAFMKGICERIMGEVLDRARGSDMGERQFIQFEKSIKTFIRKTISDSVMLLDKYKGNFIVDPESLKRQEKKEVENK